MRPERVRVIGPIGTVLGAGSTEVGGACGDLAHSCTLTSAGVVNVTADDFGVVMIGAGIGALYCMQYSSSGG